MIAFWAHHQLHWQPEGPNHGLYGVIRGGQVCHWPDLRYDLIELTHPAEPRAHVQGVLSPGILPPYVVTAWGDTSQGTTRACSAS
jgi:hypothetical protein